MAKPYMTMGNFNKLESARQEAKRIVPGSDDSRLVQEDGFVLFNEEVYPGMLPIYLADNKHVKRFVAILIMDKTDLATLLSEKTKTQISAAVAINETEIDELSKLKVSVDTKATEQKRGYPDWYFMEMKTYSLEELKEQLEKLIAAK